MTTQDEIMDLERRFWQAVMDMDIDSAVALLDEHSMTVSARGIYYFEPTEYKAMAMDGEARITSFEFSDERVIFPGPDVAIASYKAKQSFTMGGKNHNMVVYDTTIWVKKRGKWVASAHTETPEQQDPSVAT